MQLHAHLSSLQDNSGSEDECDNDNSSVLVADICIGDSTNSFPCLLDTGSSQFNFASPRVRRWIEDTGHGALIKSAEFCSVCSPLNVMCMDCRSSCLAHMTFDDEVCKFKQTVPLRIRFLTVWHHAQYELIIGRHTLKQYNILRMLPTRFFSDGHSLPGGVGTDHLTPRASHVRNTPIPNLAAMAVRMSREMLSNPAIPHNDEDITGGLGFREPALSWELDIAEGNTSNYPTKVYGSAAFKENCNTLFREFASVFSRTIDTEPSRVAPMTLTVDHEKWERPANHLPFRLQTTVKEAEIKRQVEKMLEFGIIRPSQQPYYSQVHLVPKPNGKWRFTIDFRNLNQCSKKAGWPLPNIASMLQKIGARRPQIFAKFDMTEGYHQFPLADESRKYTAFITLLVYSNSNGW